MEQKLKQLLNLVGLADDHVGLRGAKAGIVLETALRGWAMSLGWTCDPDRQTLDKVVNFLREHDHITPDEQARLKTDTRVRNHCAHGRWQLLEAGQVDHLVQNAEEWARKLAVRGVIGTPMILHDADLIVERKRVYIRPRRLVGWAFQGEELALRSKRGLLLLLSMMMIPVMVFSVGAAAAFGSITYVGPIIESITGATGVIILLPMMGTMILAIMLPFGIAAVLFHLGFNRMSQATETSLAAASRLWIKQNPRKTVLEVRRKDGRRKLTLTELSAECPECSADMAFVPSSRDPRASVVAECVDYPANHRYKIDPSKMTGTRAK
jgi:hypothetical protein